MVCQFSAPWEAAPTEKCEALASVVAVVICFASSIVLPSFLVMKDPMVVCSLSREGMLLLSVHPLSPPLQGGIRFFHHPLPACPWEPLARFLPFRETYGLTTFWQRPRVGSFLLHSPLIVLV